jgi:putative PIN family toxin of toxin-antitoxin system
MGQKTKEIARVVLDTNVLVSALILKGRQNTIVDLWKQRKIIPLLSKATFHELTTVLRYRKFALTARALPSSLTYRFTRALLSAYITGVPQ